MISKQSERLEKIQKKHSSFANNKEDKELIVCNFFLIVNNRKKYNI